MLINSEWSYVAMPEHKSLEWRMAFAYLKTRLRSALGLLSHDVCVPGSSQVP